MIYINRTKITAPNILIGNEEGGLKERVEAIEFYSNSANSQKSFTYKTYKDDSIKMVFNQLFHNKCAYCESNYAKVHPVEVEHFRPKGGVIVYGKLKKPGYYWLGSEWDNLLPSCIDCNRKRTQEIHASHSELLGKANLFPIRNEEERAIQPGNEVLEKRLLLNPCLDNPEEHLKFCEDGTVEPLSFMGMVSIDTYGLRRKNLVEAREVIAKEIISKINRIKWFLVQIDRITGYVTKEVLNSHFEELTKEINNLRDYMDSNKEYSGLARQIIGPFFTSFTVSV